MNLLETVPGLQKLPVSAERNINTGVTSIDIFDAKRKKVSKIEIFPATQQITITDLETGKVVTFALLEELPAQVELVMKKATGAWFDQKNYISILPIPVSAKNDQVVIWIEKLVPLTSKEKVVNVVLRFVQQHTYARKGFPHNPYTVEDFSLALVENCNPVDRGEGGIPIAYINFLNHVFSDVTTSLKEQKK